MRAALDYLAISERIFRAGIPSLPRLEDMFVGHDVAAPGLIYSDPNVQVVAIENSHFSHPSATADGRKDMSLAYRFDTPGGSVVFTGDTGPSQAVEKLARNADLLVSEVYVPAPAVSADSGSAVGRELADHLAREHLTPEAVGRLAVAAGVRAVLLTHLVLPAGDEAASELRARVRRYYPGPVTPGHDLLSVEVPHRP